MFLKFYVWTTKPDNSKFEKFSEMLTFFKNNYWPIVVRGSIQFSNRYTCNKFSDEYSY